MILTFDIETLRGSHEVKGGWKNIKDFGLSVCCVHDNGTDNYLDYIHDRSLVGLIGSRLDKEGLVSLFEKTERIVSFNGEAFDFIVLEAEGFPVQHWKHKSFDILARFHEAAGHRISLDNLAYEVLGERKSLSGDKAVDYWRAATKLLACDADTEFDHECYRNTAHDLFHKVIDYCRHDVELTKRIYDRLVQRDGWITINLGNRAIKLDMQ